MDVVIRSLATTLLALAIPLASAQTLSLTIANTVEATVAGQAPIMKNLQFVFRVNGCADLSKAKVAATAEGIVGNARRTIALDPRPVQTQPGVYAIGDQWGTDGTWVVAITANCESATAGAIVQINARTFVRDGTQFFSRAPSPADIETALKAYASPVSVPR
jgi:hypothetical protein